MVPGENPSRGLSRSSSHVLMLVFVFSGYFLLTIQKTYMSGELVTWNCLWKWMYVIVCRYVALRGPGLPCARVLTWLNKGQELIINNQRNVKALYSALWLLFILSAKWCYVEAIQQLALIPLQSESPALPHLILVSTELLPFLLSIYHHPYFTQAQVSWQKCSNMRKHGFWPTTFCDPAGQFSSLTLTVPTKKRLREDFNLKNTCWSEVN